MKIALIGYGRMGHEVEAVALEKKHEIVLRIDKGNSAEMERLKSSGTDVAMEFTTPATAFDNIRKCLEQGVPVVSGTTGWNDRMDEIHRLCRSLNGAFFHAANFNIGVNILFHLNRELARIMNRFPRYEPSIDETHHTRKLDAPSGTAVVLAGDLLERYPGKKAWELNETSGKDKLLIRAFREGDVPGTHVVRYESPNDRLELIHTAFSRKGFAEGALLAAEFLPGKKGVFGMHHLLKLDNTGRS